MTTEEALKQAVEKRNAKRNAKAKELPKHINDFLGSILPIAIAQDKPTVSVVFKRENVSKTLWDELVEYGTKNLYGNYRKDMLDLIVEDVYKPYLSDYSVTAVYLSNNELHIRVTFTLEQD